MMKVLGGKHTELINKVICLLMNLGYREDESRRIASDKRVFKKTMDKGTPKERIYRYEITASRVKKSVTYGHGWIPLLGGYLKNISITIDGKISGMKKGG